MTFLFRISFTYMILLYISIEAKALINTSEH